MIFIVTDNNDGIQKTICVTASRKTVDKIVSQWVETKEDADAKANQKSG
ncbi:MAG: hypothetical protein P4N59_32600 [Negativicutes bacterium]|nr:hypothetical protein [Negativicutes bacterium]